MAASLALYRRYRPATFAEVVGQEHVTAPLMRALDADRTAHAYLFSGPRGCGKTSSARILARSLNCVDGPTSTPCGVCQSCIELAPGGSGSVDVVEIDAASHGRVEETRDLRERVFFAPIAARRKIYIIDEAHMVTTGGFNVLLKVVEEPPEHVTFIFATTEPEKVLPTIRSRTHHYPFRLIPPPVLSAHLARIAAAEHLEIEPAALALVVRAGAGSARDSLSVLDQLMAGSGPGGVTYDGAVALLGYTPEALLDRVVDALAAADGADVFEAVAQVVDSGQDPRRFAEDLLRRLRDLVMVGAVPGAGAAGLLDGPAETVERLTAQQARFGQAQALRAAELVDAGLTEIRGATAPRLHLELLLARLLLPAADGSDAGFAARLERIERRLAAPAVTASPSALTAAPTPAASGPVPAAAVLPVVADEPAAPDTVEPEREPLPEPEPAPEAEAEAERVRAAEAQPGRAAEPEPEPVRSPPPLARPAVPGSLSLVDLRKLWDDVLEDVKARSRIAHAALLGSQVVGIDAGRITVSFANDGMRTNFTRGNRVPVLVSALESLLALKVEIDTVVGAGSAPAAAEPTSHHVAPPPRPSPPPAPRRPPAATRESAATREPPATPRAAPTSSAAPTPSASPDTTPVADGAWPDAAVPGGPADGPAPAGPPAVTTGHDEISPDDPDLDDPGVRGAELLSRELGAEVIDDRPNV